jgi:hypothetical protein
MSAVHTRTPSTRPDASGILRTAWHDFREHWTQGDVSQRILYAAGTLLIVSGLFHVGVWAASERTWEGPVSWRKPILFGVSTGVTCLSLGWVLGWQRWRKTGSVIAVPTAGAAVIEVALITLQTWRGAASHFNLTTPFDAFVNYAIDVLITVITLAILAMTVRSFGPLRKRCGMPPKDLALAIRFGMILLAVSCLFGYWMLWYGARQVAVGQSPEVFGAAGVVKFVHGMPMHAIQALPLGCWLLAKLSVARPWRTRAVALLGTGFTLLTLFAAVQTFRGRARTDLDPGSAVILVAAACILLVPVWLAVLKRGLGSK